MAFDFDGGVTPPEKPAKPPARKTRTVALLYGIRLKRG